MNGREYRFPEIDKSAWSDGPWLHEPDKVVWVDDKTGFDCMIIRNSFGALCGYIGVPVEHPWYGVHYDDPDVNVHGGVTFASHGENSNENEYKIHNPAIWWLGFDACHSQDLVPAMIYDSGYLRDCVYRDVAYITAEIEHFASQAQAAVTVDLY